MLNDRVSPARAANVLGWRSTTPLGQGLDETVARACHQVEDRDEAA